jgi:hypothetical protein
VGRLSVEKMAPGLEIPFVLEVASVLHQWHLFVQKRVVGYLLLGAWQILFHCCVRSSDGTVIQFL